MLLGVSCAVQTVGCQQLFLLDRGKKGSAYTGVVYSFLLSTPETAGESSRKSLGSTRNSKELPLEWEQPRLQLRREVSYC